MENAEFLSRTRALIDRECTLGGERWKVLEVLSDEPGIVLRRAGAEGETPIQADAYGNPLRRAPETRIIPMFDQEGVLTPEAREVLLLLQPR